MSEFSPSWLETIVMAAIMTLVCLLFGLGMMDGRALFWRTLFWSVPLWAGIFALITVRPSSPTMFERAAAVIAPLVLVAILLAYH